MVVSNMFFLMSTPKFEEIIHFDDQIFFKGLKPPTRYGFGDGDMGCRGFLEVLEGFCFVSRTNC